MLDFTTFHIPWCDWANYFKETMDVHFNRITRVITTNPWRDGTFRNWGRFSHDGWQNLYEQSEKLKDNFGGLQPLDVLVYVETKRQFQLYTPTSSPQIYPTRFWVIWGFQKRVLGQGKARFGSGWTWGYWIPTRETEIISTPNQDFPEMDKYGRKVPLWELTF